MRLQIPIIIGTIPLMMMAPPPPMPSAPGFEGPAAIDGAVPPPLPEGDGAMPPPLPEGVTVGGFEPPPPSYEASATGAYDVRGERDNEFLMGEAQFAPQYQYYDWSQTNFAAKQ